MCRQESIELDDGEHEVKEWAQREEMQEEFQDLGIREQEQVRMLASLGRKKPFVIEAAMILTTF